MQIIKEVAKNANMGIEAINDIAKFIDDDNMRKVVQNQREELASIKAEAEKLLSDSNEKVELGFVKKTMLKGAIGLKAGFDNSTKNIAEMLIEGTNMGINNIKSLTNARDKNDIPNVCSRLLRVYDNNVRDLREFL